MALSREELATRIKAARLLRGMSQDVLADRLQEAGLHWRLAGQLERGEVELKSLHCYALARALDMPQGWFVDPLEDLFGGQR